MDHKFRLNLFSKKTWFLILLVAFAFIFVVMLLPYIPGSNYYKFSEDKMDVNGDGKVDWDEAFLIWDLIEREVVIQGESCTEYSDSKTGVPMYVECSGEVRAL